MTIQVSTAVGKAMLDAIETAVGTSPHFRVSTGSQPADAAAADSGSNLLDLTLPSDWMAAASNAGQVCTKAKSGTWSGTAGASGTAGHFRVKDSTNTTPHLQGSCGQGTGDLSFDNSALVNGQTVNVNTFTLQAANN